MMATFLPLLLAGCADVSAIEDGARYGDVEVIQDWFTSIALVSTDQTTLLIDAGYRPNKIASALADRGIDPADVDHVLITHGHDDHIGALSLYTSAEVWALAEEADDIPGEVSVIEPGAEVMLGDVAVEAFAMPGHTPGSAVYRVGSALVLGDAALIDRDGALVPVPEKRSEDPEGAEQALVELAVTLSERPDVVSHLVPAHSGGSSDLSLLWAWRPQ
jgi:glyoxylase-like metal-dependent hydrolase (beta-lactamase superfamily II)